MPRPTVPAAPEQETIESDLRELQQLLSVLFHALRKPATEFAELESKRHAFHAAGLRERHGRLLFTLALSGPLSVGELAARVALAPATTSLLIGELDRAGFLERGEDAADHRRTIVSLPEELRPALERFAQTRLAPLRRTLEQLEPERRRHFIEGLRTLSAEAARRD